MTLTASVMILVPVPFIQLYAGRENAANAAMFAFAVQCLAIAAAFQLFDGAQAVAAGALRGLQDTTMPLVIALFGYWAVGFSASVWFGLYTPLEGIGVWIGLMLGLVVAAVLLTLRWHRRDRLGLVPG
jgi:MATE family multidrug resistance protein